MNTTYLIFAVLAIVVLAVVAYYATVPTHQTQQLSTGVSEEEINSIGQYPEMNLPADIVPDENLPNPEDTIVIDDNTVDMPLPEDI